ASTEQTIAVDTGAAYSIDGDVDGEAVVGGNAYDNSPLTVLVKDSGNNPVAGAAVVFNAPVSGASAGLSAGSCTTDADGRCGIDAESNDRAGSFVVTASIANGASVDFTLTNLADTTPAQI